MEFLLDLPIRAGLLAFLTQLHALAWQELQVIATDYPKIPNVGHYNAIMRLLIRHGVGVFSLPADFSPYRIDNLCQKWGKIDIFF